MLKLGGSWATLHFCRCIKFANTSPETVDYVLYRLNISLDSFRAINWNAIDKVCQLYGIKRIVRTIKMMYPTNADAVVTQTSYSNTS